MSWIILAALGCGKPVPPAPAAPPLHDPVGDWAGDISLPGGATLPFVVHITPSEGGGFTGTADSPQQGAFGIPVSGVTADGDHLTVEIKAIRGTFDGQFTDPDTLQGTWKQGVARLDLTLARSAEVAPPARPQMPEGPFPYAIEEVSIPVGSHALAGTLTIPEGGGPFPGVVLITGSGPQDRDETLMGHKPFWVIADHFSRNGIAVLRYDDRGVGESTGDFGAATSADFGEDAAAALAALRARPEVGAAGLLGHSEGGLIAPLIAPDTSPDFLLLLAPPSVPIPELMLAQVEAVSRSGGATDKDIETILPLQRDIYAAAAAGDRAAAAALVQRMPGADALEADALEAQVSALFSPWWTWFLQHDPTPSLRALDVPVLAMWGDRDVQVLSAQNAPAFDAAVAGNARAEGRVFAGLNHLFQPAETGSVAEYAQIETTIDPRVLEAMTDWLGARAP